MRQTLVKTKNKRGFLFKNIKSKSNPLTLTHLAKINKNPLHKHDKHYHNHNNYKQDHKKNK